VALAWQRPSSDMPIRDRTFQSLGKSRRPTMLQIRCAASVSANYVVRWVDRGRDPLLIVSDCHCIAIGLANCGQVCELIARSIVRSSSARRFARSSLATSAAFRGQISLPVTVAYHRSQAAPGHSPLVTVRGQLDSAPNIPVLSVRNARERASEREASAADPRPRTETAGG
jgi:hypothetical protein